MSLDDSYKTARFNLSYLLLRQGRFEEGWFCLEYRDWRSGLANHLQCPLWQGEPLAGKSILIGYEAGHGDMIQFCRYAAVLKAQGAASVTLVCHPALKVLFTSAAGVDDVIALDEPIPASGWDYWTPLLSIPHHCKTRLDSIPANIPYLHAPAELIEKWAALLPQAGLRVGLVWKGNPLFENDADRSLPSLDVLAPLGAVANVNFVSLQKGAGEEEALHPPARLASHPLRFAAERLCRHGRCRDESRSGNLRRYGGGASGGCAGETVLGIVAGLQDRLALDGGSCRFAMVSGNHATLPPACDGRLGGCRGRGSAALEQLARARPSHSI